MFSLQGSASFKARSRTARASSARAPAPIASRRTGRLPSVLRSITSTKSSTSTRTSRSAPTGANATSTGSSSSRLGEHWSVGARGEIESSTFDNTELAIAAAPAVEFNFFPYSQYTRRQLRAQYGVGVSSFRYYEETLYGKQEETLPNHELSLTLEQRERWGSIEASIEWSQYLHDLSKSRLEAMGQLSFRLARGLSVAAEMNASRIRDQLSIPARAPLTKKCCCGCAGSRAATNTASRST